MQIEQIVQMESDKLELSGLFDERSQEPVKGLLLYLYTAVDIWMLLSPDDRRSVRNFNEFFEKERVVKLFLKELKSKKNKEKTAPAPNKSFNIKYRLGIWSKRSYETDDQAADIHLERVKGKKSAPQAVNTQEEQAIAAKRAEDNEKLEQEIAERKAGAVPYEEYIRQKNEKKS